MDFSIWVQSENQDFTDESSYPTTGWEYNAYFDSRLDVIEDNVLNEKSCKEVMKILTNEADSEIVDLEADVLMVQNRLACENYMDVAALNEKNVNLESMLTPSQNENQQTAELGVGSSNLCEGHDKTKAIEDHSSKDIETVKFKDGCTVQANNRVLASLVEVFISKKHLLEPKEPVILSADITATSQIHSTKRRVTRSSARDVASSESPVTPVPQVAPPPSSLAYIDNMSLVQLKALAYQHNIHGVSKIRKADLQKLLRLKLRAT